MDSYSAEIERHMQAFFRMLSEKDRRRYAAVEAVKLGHGGLEYVSELFRIDPKTIRRGLEELRQTDDPAGPRVRRSPRRNAPSPHTASGESVTPGDEYRPAASEGRP